jgi:hypothetical protein
MTGWHTPATTPTIDPYRFPGAPDGDTAFGDHLPPAPDGTVLGDYLLPAPHTDRRLPLPLEPADRRRLDLHAALTTAGIAPLPGDLAAIEALCALDDTTNATLQRWIARTP